MKILVIFLYTFLSLFDCTSIENNNQAKEINMNCVYEEVASLEYIYDNYKIIERDNKIDVLYKDNRIILIENVKQYKVLSKDDTITIFKKYFDSNYVEIYKFNKGKIILNKLIDNQFIGNFDVIYYKNKYLFISSINEYENIVIKHTYSLKQHLQEINGIVLLFNDELEIINCKIYGGILDDYFYKIYYDDYDEIVYITGRKDQESGYDFGFGGNGTYGYILLSLTSDLEINNYCLFKNEIKNIEIKEKLTIYTIYEIFSLNFDLTMVSSLKFDSECVFGMSMNQKLYAIFTRRELKIYDFKQNRCLDIYEYKVIEEVMNIELIRDYLLVQSNNNKYYKMIFYNDLLSDRTFIYDTDDLYTLNNKIDGLPKQYELKQIYYQENYNPSIFGKYQIIFDYDYFELTSDIIVLERHNVTDGYIYPKGYRLLFSGNAYLNGEEIFNNYELIEPGKYELKLLGKDEEIIINFVVFEMDILFFEEGLKYWDYEVKKNQELQIDLKYTEEVKIKSLYVNDELYDFEDNEEENIISIKFKEKQCQLYEKIINKITYEINDVEYTKELNYRILIKVLENNINLTNNYYNNDEYFIFEHNITYNDSIEQNQVRFLKVEYNNEYQYIPLKNNSHIIIDYNQTTLLKYYLVYDVYGKLYQEQILFDIEYDLSNDQTVGILEVIVDENTNILQGFNIKIKNDKNIKKIVIDDKIEYSNNDANDYKLVLFSVIFVLMLFIIGKIIKCIKNSRIILPRTR